MSNVRASFKSSLRFHGHHNQRVQNTRKKTGTVSGDDVENSCCLCRLHDRQKNIANETKNAVFQNKLEQPLYSYNTAGVLCLIRPRPYLLNSYYSTRFLLAVYFIANSVVFGEKYRNKESENANQNIFCCLYHSTTFSNSRKRMDATWNNSGELCRNLT